MTADADTGDGVQEGAAASPFGDILVVLDRWPRAAMQDRRQRQLLGDLAAVLRREQVHLAFGEGGSAGGGGPESFGLSEPIVLTPSWLSERSFSYSTVFFAGPATFRRFLPVVKRSQPQATLIGLLPDVSPLPVGLEARYDVDDERAGSRYLDDLRREKRAAAVLGLDVALVPGPAPEHAPHGASRVRPYPLRVDRVTDVPGFRARRGLLSLGHFGVEPGEPDEEAAVLVSTHLRDLVGAIDGAVPLTVVLEDPPSGLTELGPPVGVGPHELLRQARVLVVARTYGEPAAVDALLAAAAEAGTPVVAMTGAASANGGAVEAADIVDLARHAVHLATDGAAWASAASTQQAWATARSDCSTRQLRRILAEQGIVCTSGATASPLATPGRGASPGHRTTQGQVQSAGWAQFRPPTVAFRRATLSPDDLRPDVAYGQWFDAHPLTSDGVAQMRTLAAALRDQPLISIVMPVYNTDPAVLTDAVESVLAQIYPLWELCAVDDASTSEATVTTLEALAQRDDRIRVARLAENAGIVGASNEALRMARGDFVGLLDHDDLLTPDALFEVVSLLNEEPDIDFLYSDEDKLDLDGIRTSPFFKPSWSPHLHLGVNYVTHFAVYRRSFLDHLGGFRRGFDGSQDYDLSLRATEVARRIGHIAKPIYTWRMVPGSAAVRHDAKPYALDAARRALQDAVDRRGHAASIEEGLVPGTWRPRYRLTAPPKVSLLIPTRNGRHLLERCIQSVRERTTYRNFEIVIVDNDSDDPDTLAYLRGVDAKVVRYPHRFNYARQMNLAAEEATGDQILFLNNDLEVITPGWLEAMVELAQHDEVGAVGARLLFPGGRAQHEGVFIGFGGGSAGNADFGGYFGLGRMIRDATAVTAACLLMRLEPFHAIGGFDERLRVAFNDVDLCLRLRQQGYQVVYTPYAELFHAESASRGKLHPAEDEEFFVRRWGTVGTFRDPFYNPNLDAERPFCLRR